MTLDEYNNECQRIEHAYNVAYNAALQRYENDARYDVFRRSVEDAQHVAINAQMFCERRRMMSRGHESRGTVK